MQYVDKWDYGNTMHPNNDDAILRVLGPLVSAPNTIACPVFSFAYVPIACPVSSFVSHVRVKIFPLARRTCGGVFACFVISIRMFVISPLAVH